MLFSLFIPNGGQAAILWVRITALRFFFNQLAEKRVFYGQFATAMLDKGL